MERVVPGPGQESVWDYPRPPRVEPVSEVIRVEFGGSEIVRTEDALRVLETSHPPVYYVPFDDVMDGVLIPSPRTTFCEFKGVARYHHLVLDGRRSDDAAWTYPDPTPGYGELAGAIAFYPSRVDACWVGAEQVRPQEGDFYGGWVTSSVVGPFKGAPGTRFW